jgi:hypothetical protein
MNGATIGDVRLPFDTRRFAPHKQSMIELIIERWSQRDGSVDWLWSIWQDGDRKHMGSAHRDPESAEMEARAACHQLFGRPPENVTVL